MIIFLLALIGSASAFSPSATGPRGGVSRPAIIIMAEMDPVKAKIAAAKAAKAAKAAGSTAAEPVAAKVANEPEAAQAAEPAVASALNTPVKSAALSGAQETVVLMVSDFQIGKRTPTYNSEIARLRVREYASKACAEVKGSGYVMTRFPMPV